MPVAIRKRDAIDPSGTLASILCGSAAKSVSAPINVLD